MTKKHTKSLTIKHLAGIDEMMRAYPLISTMYKDMDRKTFKSYIQEMVVVNNYRMVAVFMDDEIVGVCGYWVFLMLYCGRYLQASNLVVAENYRSHGIGQKILSYLGKIAREMGCKKLVLDSYTENKRSHPLYFREGFYIRGFHFMKDL